MSNNSSNFDQLTMNIIGYLETQLGVCCIQNEVKAPAERPAVLMWEQKNSLLLPTDLKNFYLSSNGFQMTWSVQMENLAVPVGQMHINSIGQLTRLDHGVSEGAHLQPSLWDLVMEDEAEEVKKPSFVECKIFELDPCNGYGKVCLVYNQTSRIWYLDRSLRWHYLSDSFLAYYRLMLVHLGLPHWQLALTDIGLPASAKQWFHMYAPLRLEVDTHQRLGLNEGDNLCKTSTLDASKVFRDKPDRSKGAVAQTNTNSSKPTLSRKQKTPTSMPATKSVASVSKQVSQSSSQAAAKINR